ncbi:MAG: TetR/AcrR family transcriptional regulator [Acidimicrobiales bacterium]|jgi:TetR/AcrR family transcriptional repressor of nem operon
MGTLPITEQGRQTRRRIVSAATEVVIEKGATGASLDEVGARSGASRSQIYHYFEDKNDLLRAVAGATTDAVLDPQEALFTDLETWEGWQRWTDALVEFQMNREGRGGCPIANLVAQLGERDNDARVVLADGFDRWEASIRSGLAALVATGELRADSNLDWLATSTLASVQGGLMLTQARRDPRMLRRALDSALALINIYRLNRCADPLDAPP